MRIDGVVELGPFCPVERPGEPCPTPPGAFTGAEATAVSGDDEVRAPLTPAGTFQLAVPQGRWRVTSTAGMSCDELVVETSSRVTLTCDTGIR